MPDFNCTGSERPLQCKTVTMDPSARKVDQSNRYIRKGWVCTLDPLLQHHSNERTRLERSIVTAQHNRDTMGSSPCRFRELRVSNSGKEGGLYNNNSRFKRCTRPRAARAARRHPWSLLKLAHERRVISALARRWARLVCFLCDQLPTALVKDLSVTGSVATTDRAGRSAGSFVEWPSGARLFACGMCWRSTLLTRVAKERVQRRVLGTHGGRRGWC